MIKGLYETHLYVEDLQRSINFYRHVLGLQLCRFEAGRRAAFLWIGQPQAAMLGLWEKPAAEIDSRHFAFTCDPEFILTEAIDFLTKHGVQPYNFLKDGSMQPMVFTWMPAVAIYFNDPDGHQLEFIAILEGEAHPAGEVVSYEAWLQLNQSGDR
ncbi:VOC family protein [Chitinophaga nivalis]|uniref:VOC family protein n=1 Tax=Chitinophaga nivalis TaxID=2991709 RepID=A0ABT3IND4_9BACT|nr:VOC family protein [Chitinophaga nivalis]MCW3464833.1 VOC family protein [Chitinophaga nivalis]MCW3485476.1 VOC family protein [Chitinophaga nivalis]